MPDIVDFSHKNNLEEFIKDNIKVINKGFNDFKTAMKSNHDCKYDETDVKNYLRNKLFKEAETNKDTLLSEFESKDFKKDAIEDIANDYIYNSSHAPCW